VLRSLLTIIRYEFLMQLKSVRFKGLCLLILLIDFGLYQGGVYRQEFSPNETFLAYAVLFFYLIAVVFAGLYSMGRIRSTGMHAILMVRPFPTFILPLGQMIGGLLSFFIPALLFFFPSGLLLRWQLDIEFRTAPLFYMLIFYFIPGGWCILSITIWIRTCFKNNIMALIILGFIFAGMVPLANSHYLNIPGPDHRLHNFVPMVSLFSEEYWRNLKSLEQDSAITFFNPGEWFNMLLSLAYSCLFLLLSCYHLRRTEPQRKVLGSYGRRWYHTPTFLKIACDLKIDPHVTYRSHVILILFLLLIAGKTAWPLALPVWRNYRARREAIFSSQQTKLSPEELKKRYDPNYLPQERILPVKILSDEQTILPKSILCKRTFRCDVPASGTVAIISNWGRWAFDIQELSVEGKKIPFIRQEGNYFIEGKDLESYCDGTTHTMVIRAPLKQGMTADSQWGYFIHPQGFYFLQKKKSSTNPDGRTQWTFAWIVRDLWPTRISITLSSDLPLLDSPVLPVKIEADPRGKKKGFWRRRDKNPTYIFDVPRERNGPRGLISFGSAAETFVDMKGRFALLRFAVYRTEEKILRQMLELADPVLDDFSQLYNIKDQEPIVLLVSRGNMYSTLRSIKTYHNRYRTMSSHFWGQDDLYIQLDAFEKEMLTDVFSYELCGKGPSRFNNLWDLYEFMQLNIARGLNHRMSLKREFLPFPFAPIYKHIDPNQMRQMEGVTREKLLEDQNQIPLFQMLYLVMGHETWVRMLGQLKPKLKKDFVSPEMVEQAAQEVFPESLDWFFDYWTRTGMGYPSYKVESAVGRILSSEEEDNTEYEVEARIANLGTGRMPVPVLLETAKDPIRDKVWIGEKETVTWKVKCKHLPKFVKVDPEGWIMMLPVWNEKSTKWVGDSWAEVFIQTTKKSGM